MGRVLLKLQNAVLDLAVARGPGERFNLRGWGRNKNRFRPRWNSRNQSRVPLEGHAMQMVLQANLARPRTLGDELTKIAVKLVPGSRRFFHIRSRRAFYEKRRYITRWNDERRTVDSRPEVARRSNRRRRDDPGPLFVHQRWSGGRRFFSPVSPDRFSAPNAPISTGSSLLRRTLFPSVEHRATRMHAGFLFQSRDCEISSG